MRKTIGETNRIRVEEFYIDRCALKYENVFSEVVEPGMRRTRLGASIRGQPDALDKAANDEVRSVERERPQIANPIGHALAGYAVYCIFALSGKINN
jgi:hypothetical protein